MSARQQPAAFSAFLFLLPAVLSLLGAGGVWWYMSARQDWGITRQFHVRATRFAHQLDERCSHGPWRAAISCSAHPSRST